MTEADGGCGQAAVAAADDAGEVERAGGENDRRRGGHRRVVGDEEARDARDDAEEDGDPHLAGHGLGPEARSGGRQHHEPDHHQRAEGVEAADEVEDHQRHEGHVRHRAGAADDPEEPRIEALHDQRAIDDRERDQRHGGDGQDEHQRRVVQRQHRAEQDVEEVDIGAAERDD